MQRDHADMWEKSFRAVMTILTTLAVAGVGAIYRKTEETTDRLARIETAMVTKDALGAFNEKIFDQGTRIAVLEYTCKKLAKGM